MQLVDRKRREPGEAADPTDVRLDRCPAGRVGLGDPVDDRGEARCGESRACEVETTPARLLRISRNDLQRGKQQDRRDGEVDVEDRPPVGELGEDAADEDADRRARAADRTPRRERLRPPRALVGGGDDRQCRRGEDRGAEPLACAGSEQHRGASGHRRSERGRGEDAEAGHEHAAATEQIGSPSSQQRQTAENQRVVGDRPADVSRSDAEVPRKIRS